MSWSAMNKQNTDSGDWSVSCTLEEVLEHEEDGGEPVQASESVGQAFVVAAEATRLPAEGAFYDPAFGQQHKALLGF